MNWRKKLLKKSNLYVIVDEDIKSAEAAITNGADVIQLRIKNKSDRNIVALAKKLRELTKKHNVLFLINDRIDIAQVVGADGIHLGQEDISIREARKILGPDYIIGASTHSVREVEVSLLEKPDYIAIGSIFKTATKPDLNPLGIDKMQKILKQTSIPYFVIGGINLKNVKALLEYKVNRVALYKAIIKSNNPGGTTRKFKGILLNYEDAHRKNKK
jgi:thiamine-phosphate pyrophosphorylase